MKFSTGLLLLALGGSTQGFVTNNNNNSPWTPIVRSATELSARKPFITGNWKLNPQSKAEAVDLARGIVATITKDKKNDDDSSVADVGLFVPFPFLQTVKEIVGDKVVVGAQVRQATEHFSKTHQKNGISRCSIFNHSFQWGEKN